MDFAWIEIVRRVTSDLAIIFHDARFYTGFSSQIDTIVNIRELVEILLQINIINNKLTRTFLTRFYIVDFEIVTSVVSQIVVTPYHYYIRIKNKLI